MIEDKKRVLKQQFWNITNKLRGKMDVIELWVYIFYFIFNQNRFYMSLNCGWYINSNFSIAELEGTEQFHKNNTHNNHPAWLL